MGVEKRGAELPAARAVHFRFPPASVAVPASVCCSYSEILRNVAKFSPIAVVVSSSSCRCRIPSSSSSSSS